MGFMNKQHRVYTKAAFKQGRVLGYSRNGNIEWITIFATVCADGTALPPAIIFSGQSGYLPDTWVEGVKIAQY
jgi:hypothetical protein